MKRILRKSLAVACVIGALSVMPALLVAKFGWTEFVWVVIGGVKCFAAPVAAVALIFALFVLASNLWKD